MAEMGSNAKSETAKREEEILAFWRENKTFQRSLEKSAPKGEFVFYDGPPFATGLPHHGSLLSSIIKDVIPRYKTMQGYRVRRRWGWDTHGLPIESLVEKELGLKTKKDILEIGVAAFNEKAKSMVLQFVHDWEKYVERIGRWVDFTNSYKTMDNSYIESVWWALKQLWDTNLLYEGRKVLMYCPHCETPLAKAEIAMDHTYKDITEEAVTVKLKVKNPEKHGLPENTYLLAWTTTPWTLPGNVGLAVKSDITYVVGMEGGNNVVTAEALTPRGMEVQKKISGKDLVGIEYEPLFAVPALKTDTAYKVWLADFVTTTEGTGIVHTAVMYGEDDYKLGEREKLPMVQMLNANGTYNDVAPEFIRGKYIKDAERDIKRDLEGRGLLFARENHTHSYPHCYRCGTPLIYNAVASWFINIQKIKAKMLSENEKINWVPEHLKHGRFYNIMDNAPDWTISRNRFWASPLPIWKSKEGKVLVVGSLEEIHQRAKKSGNRYFVMRHGEAANNVQNIVSSGKDDAFGLTEKGRDQVRAAAAGMKSKPTRIYSSPIRRARESAEHMAEAFGIPKKDVVLDDRLMEFDFGSLNRGSFSEFIAARNAMQSLSDTVPGGESYLTAKIRFGSFITDIDARHKDETILVVTHGIGCESLDAIAEGADEGASWKMIREVQRDYASIKEITYRVMPRNGRFELDLHRPYTDSIVLIGDDGAEYSRIPEVVDCWVESGSMPFAEYHYPFENRSEFEKRAPGDFIAEYIAQTRTWFYYMHVMGIALFNRLAFRNVVSTGNLLAADGAKISKSKRNYTDPLELINQYGSDAVRLYLMGSPVMQAEDVRFRDEDVRDAHNRIIGMLWNTFKFFDLYQKEYDGTTEARKSTHVLDRWILARLDETIEETTRAMDAYTTPEALRALRAFIDEYSTWYVRRSRDRVKGEWHDKHYSLATQKEVLTTVAKLLAPIAPFIAESIWRGIESGGSVHLTEWPRVPSKGFFARLFGTKTDPVLAEMATVRSLVSKALEARDKAGIKVRQPLAKLTIKTPLNDELLAVIREEVNVKGIEVRAIEGDVELDTTLTPELKEEGFVRDLIRSVQGARKEVGLNPGEKAKVTLQTTKDVEAIVARHTKEIADATHTTIAFGTVESAEQKIGDYSIAIKLVRE